MRLRSAALQERLSAHALVPRDFLWVEPRNRDTGARVGLGFWSGLGVISAPVEDPASGATVTRTYDGAGNLVDLSPIPLAIGTAVQTVTISMSQIAPGAEMAIRGYDLRRARVEIHRGYLDPLSMLLPERAEILFVGFVDDAEIVTPTEGGEGGITLTAAHATQELLRSNAAKRSDADQRRRQSGDGFFRDAPVVGGWTIWWGQEADKA